MAKRSPKTAKPVVALKFHAFAKPRATPITLEPAIPFPLPAGQNPGDPYYGKDWLNPRDPADYAAALEKVGSAARAVGARALVLHWADWVAKADEVGAEDRAFVERSRDLFVHATAALDARDLSEETRQAIDTALRAAFQIGEIKAALQQALHARKDMPRARAEPAQKKQAERQRLDAEARRAWIQKTCADNGKEPDEPGLTGWLIDKLGAPKTVKELAALTRKINRDLQKLRTS